MEYRVKGTMYSTNFLIRGKVGLINSYSLRVSLSITADRIQFDCIYIIKDKLKTQKSKTPASPIFLDLPIIAIVSICST